MKLIVLGEKCQNPNSRGTKSVFFLKKKKYIRKEKKKESQIYASLIFFFFFNQVLQLCCFAILNFS